MAARPTSDDWNAVPFRHSYVPLPRLRALCATKGGTYTGNDANAVSCKTALSTENPLFSTRLQRSSLHLDRHAADVRVHGVAVDQELRRKREAARRQLAIDVETESSIAADRKLSCKQHAARCIRDHVAALGRRAAQNVVFDRLQGAPDDIGAAHVLLCDLDVAEHA